MANSPELDAWNSTGLGMVSSCGKGGVEFFEQGWQTVFTEQGQGAGQAAREEQCNKP
jgi:hypothetical protein